jgi:MOSC domain-containing protein YiiM
MKIDSIQVGKPRTIHFQGKPITTGIFKFPVKGTVMLRKLNLDGDEQADLRVHGGEDKALYAYSRDAYPNWKLLRPDDEFLGGAMGENLTVDSLPEDRIHVGDRFRVGGALIEAAQPRFPCYKLAAMYEDSNILKQFNKINRTGVYFRVLKEGLLTEGDSFELLSKGSVSLSISDFYGIALTKKCEPNRLAEILKIKALPEPWREKFKSWLKEG